MFAGFCAPKMSQSVLTMESLYCRTAFNATKVLIAL